MARTETDGKLSRLERAVREAAELLARLHPLITEPENDGPDLGTIGRSAPESSEPWARQAAGAYFDLYFGTRRVAREMRADAGLHLPVFDDAYGTEALTVIANCAPSATDLILGRAARELERLVAQGRQVPAVDEDEPWADLPRTAAGPLACPYCDTYGLRMLRRKGEVRCFFPGCKDGDGNPTRARMEPG